MKTKPAAEALHPSLTVTGGTDLSQGSIKYFADCSANPLDMRPAADLILRAIDDHLQALPSDQPLVVLFADGHGIVTSSILQHTVLQRLHERNENFTVNMEFPHHFWAMSAGKNMGIDVSPDHLQTPGYVTDPDGQATLSAYLGYKHMSQAPLSVKNTMAFCYENKIATAFNDAARCLFFDSKAPFIRYRSLFLDSSDSLTRTTLEQYTQQARSEKKSKTLMERLPTRLAISPGGMAVRNLVMTELALEHAHKHNAKIIVDLVGREHLFGNAKWSFDRQDSLSATFSRAGAMILPVFTNYTFDYGNIEQLFPPEAQKAFPNSVILQGLAEDRRLRGQETEEKELIENIHKASGGTLQFRDTLAEVDFYKAEARKQALRLSMQPVPDFS